MAEWIVSSSVLIALVLALRRLLRGRISPWLQYALWLLVLVRLLVPVSFGQSRLSIANLTAVSASQPTVQPAPQRSGTAAQEHAYAQAIVQAAEQAALQPADKTRQDSAAPVALHEQLQSAQMRQRSADWLSRLISCLWVAGSLMTGAVFLASNLFFAAKLKKTRRLMTDTGRLLVYLTDAAQTPCLFGIVHPAIYLTTEAAQDEAMLRHAVIHEAVHYCHADHIWSVLRCVCLALHWYNPLVWWAALASQRDSELACDAATIAQLGETERAAYGRTLIKMTCQKRAAPHFIASSMTGSKNSVKERIVMLTKKPKMAVCTLVAVLLFAALLAGCTFTGAKADAPAATEDAQAQRDDTPGKDGEAALPEQDAALLTNEHEAIGQLTGELEEQAGSSTVSKLFASLTAVQPPVQLALTGGGAIIGDYYGWGARKSWDSNNGIFLSNILSQYDYLPVDETPSTQDAQITLSRTSENGWSITGCEGSNILQLNMDGHSVCYKAVPQDDALPPAGDVLRAWYDEAEWVSVGGDLIGRQNIVIADKGQDYLTAAQQFWQTYEDKRLLCSAGSQYRCSYLSCSVEALDETTARFRERGRIEDNTWMFKMTLVFVPENERAKVFATTKGDDSFGKYVRYSNYSDCITQYKGSDPGVPAGAYETYRYCFIRLEDDGWHVVSNGVNWS